ncbi:MAG TPA: c-type cytochrome [Caulobacteraceae bacterium]|nr:c-type cytochrome [Caulobacteraceae bacterium]
MKSLAAACVLAMAVAPARAADIGRDLFDAQCASCHTLTGHSTVSGPSLKGVMWRKIADLGDFRYTVGLKAQVGSWSPGRLDAYLHNAQKFAPGTDMFWNITDASERKAIIDFLAHQ